MKKLLLIVIIPLAGCVLGDDNDKAVYGKETGLPVNCRAYVQVVIDSYRAKTHPVDGLFAGLERNCGANGSGWKNNR